MTTRETSKRAYAELLASGAIRGQQERVLGSIVRRGPSTSGELLSWMEIENVNAWRARFTELQARGLIHEITQRECKITGRLAVVWDYTGRTKPLDAKRGHRIDGKAWKALAMDAIACLKRHSSPASVELESRRDELL